jgi:hypothetical protein
VNIDDLDALHARLREGEGRAGVALVDLDANPTFTMLSAGRLQGETARRVGAAVAAARGLWALYERVRSTLNEAEHTRGTEKRPDPQVMAELARLLTAPVVEAPPDPTRAPGVGHDERVDVATAIERILAIHQRALAAVTEVDAVWSRVVPQLDRARRELGPMRARAAAIDAAGEPALASLAELVARTELRLGDDPLGLTGAELDTLDAATGLATQRVADLERLHATVEDDRARGEQLLVELIAKGNEVRSGYARAIEKVARPVGVADLGPGDLDALRALRAEAVDALAPDAHAALHWRIRRARLDAWLARADALAMRLDACIDANTAPLRRRDELRGLLAALEAKAAGRDRIERPETVERLRAAREALSVAPSDLDRAASLLDTLARDLTAKDT